MVDSYKRTYLDPRTKKVEKARIAARIVATVRSLEPNGRFLKEDPHTGCWIEIGDERAWKKAGQALRESAPEIRAESEKMLRGWGDNAGGSIADKLPVSTSKSTSSGQKNKAQQQQQQSEQRQADPPGPRHRPNPPAREGLASRLLPITTKLSDLHQHLIDSLLPSPSETVIKRFTPTHTVNCELCMPIRTHYFLLSPDNVKKISALEYQALTTPYGGAFMPGECIAIHEVAFSIDNVLFLFDAVPVLLSPCQIKQYQEKDLERKRRLIPNEVSSLILVRLCRHVLTCH